MAWKAPPNFGSLTFRRVEIVADLMGLVDLSAFSPDEMTELAAILPSHGFVPVEDPEDAEQPDPQPALEPVESAAPAEEVQSNPEATAPAEEEVGFDPNAKTVADVEAMNRNELFAFLKAHGVVRQPPIKNDELRAAAREVFAASAG